MERGNYISRAIFPSGGNDLLCFLAVWQGLQNYCRWRRGILLGVEQIWSGGYTSTVPSEHLKNKAYCLSSEIWVCFCSSASAIRRIGTCLAMFPWTRTTRWTCHAAGGTPWCSRSHLPETWQKNYRRLTILLETCRLVQVRWCCGVPSCIYKASAYRYVYSFFPVRP